MQTTTYRDYWSTKWPFYNETLPSIMSGWRFELLLNNLHLNDDEKMPPRGSPHFDRLYKVRPVLDRVVDAFKVHYKPQKNLSIDESMVGFKGRLAWIQYMPKKPRKWGIKIWTLADAANGYVSNMKVYTGKLE